MEKYSDITKLASIFVKLAAQVSAKDLLLEWVVAYSEKFWAKKLSDRIITVVAAYEKTPNVEALNKVLDVMAATGAYLNREAHAERFHRKGPNKVTDTMLEAEQKLNEVADAFNGMMYGRSAY